MSEEKLITVDLPVKERLVLTAILFGEQGRLADYRIVARLLEKVPLSGEESARIKWLNEGKTQWDPASSFATPMEFSERQIDVIKHALRKIEQKAEVNRDNFDLFALFGVEPQ